jgi:hypothetical protein
METARAPSCEGVHKSAKMALSSPCGDGCNTTCREASLRRGVRGQREKKRAAAKEEKK